MSRHTTCEVRGLKKQGQRKMKEGSGIAHLIVCSPASYCSSYSSLVIFLFTKYYGKDNTVSLRLPSEKRQLSSIWIPRVSLHPCHSNTVSAPSSNPSWYLLDVGDHMSKRSSFLTEDAWEISRYSLEMRHVQKHGIRTAACFHG